MPAWVINGRIRTPLLVMGMVEFAIAFSALYIAGLMVFGSIAASEAAIGPLLRQAIVAATVTLLSLIAVGLYQFNFRAYFHEAVVRVLVGVLGGCIALALIFAVLPSVGFSRVMTTTAIGYAIALLVCFRFLFFRTLDGNFFRHRTFVYGAGERAAAIADLRRRADRRGFVVVGQVPVSGDYVTEPGLLIDRGAYSLTDLASDRHADEIVIAADDRRGNLPVRDLLNARLAGIDVIELSDFLERETGKIRVDLLKPGWLVFAQGFRTDRVRRNVKRAFDVFASTSLIIVTAPVMLAVALAIKFDEGWNAPLLYRQVRVGLGGIAFPVLKFRSMTVDAEADGQARWAAQNDSRVTRVGRLLRQYRLDEVPQLFNVLHGEMSLVGPRPERPCFVEELQKSVPYYSVRHTVKPGLTGWAQVRYRYGASELDALEKLQYELYYIKNHSLFLDMLILLQTVEVVLWGKGAQ